MNFLRFILMNEAGTGEGGAGGAAGAQGGTETTGNLFAAAGAGAQGGNGAQGAQGAGSAGAGQAGAQGAQGQQGGFSWGAIVGDDGNFKADWTKSLPDDLKPAAETLANYKTPAEAFRALHSTKVLLGQKGNTFTIPDVNSKPEVVAAFRKAIGAPDTADGYELKRPADLPAEISWDDKAAKTYGDVMLKHHIPKAAAQELLSTQLTMEKEAVAEFAAAEKTYVQEGLTALRVEWGEAFDANLAHAATIAQKLGLSLDHDALKHKEVVQAMHKVYKWMASEDPRIEGQSTLANDPGVEADRIQTDTNHPMYKLYQSGDKATADHVRSLRERAETMKQRK